MKKFVLFLLAVGAVVAGVFIKQQRDAGKDELAQWQRATDPVA